MKKYHLNVLKHTIFLSLASNLTYFFCVEWIIWRKFFFVKIDWNSYTWWKKEEANEYIIHKPKYIHCEYSFVLCEKSLMEVLDFHHSIDYLVEDSISARLLILRTLFFIRIILFRANQSGLMTIIQFIDDLLMSITFNTCVCVCMCMCSVRAWVFLYSLSKCQPK